MGTGGYDKLMCVCVDICVCSSITQSIPFQFEIVLPIVSLIKLSIGRQY